MFSTDGLILEGLFIAGLHHQPVVIFAVKTFFQHLTSQNAGGRASRPAFALPVVKCHLRHLTYGLCITGKYFDQSILSYGKKYEILEIMYAIMMVLCLIMKFSTY